MASDSEPHAGRIECPICHDVSLCPCNRRHLEGNLLRVCAECAPALTQREASTLLGGGTNAFHKYEKGESAVSTSMSQLLRLLDKHPELVRELKADVAKGMKRAPKPARKAS